MPTIRSRQEEVDRNYQAFLGQLPALLQSDAHKGKFALMHEEKIVEFFDTVSDAYAAGKALFKSDPFSIQEVTDVAVDLGYFSHALPGR